MIRTSLLLLLLLVSQPLLATTMSEALAAFNSGEYETAVERFTALAKEQDGETEILYYLARAQYKAGDNESSRETLEALLELEAAHVEALYLLGVVNMGRVNEVSVFRKLGFAKDALAAWSDAVNADPAHVRSHYALFSYYANAPGFAGGDMEAAQAQLEEIRSLDQPYADMATAVLYIKREDFTSAERFLRSAASGISDGAFPYFALANYYAEQGRYPEALEALRKFREAERNWRDPNEAAEWYLEGNIRAGMKEVERARYAYGKALAANPGENLTDQIKSRMKKL